ncbi:MAG: hypothetical protein JO372_10420 [Solirubrobacterales bacterium]|nr:hypothetical protein [Solirubrobacterales bacterium]
MKEEHGKPGNLVLTATRLWLPLAIGIAGVVLIVLGHGNDNTRSAAGVSLLIVALIVWMINWLFRLSIVSNRDREEEERAREYFDRHGRWPGE